MVEEPAGGTYPGQWRLMDIVDLTNGLLPGDGRLEMGPPQLTQYASNDCEVIRGQWTDKIDNADPTTEFHIDSVGRRRPRSGGE